MDRVAGYRILFLVAAFIAGTIYGVICRLICMGVTRPP